MVNGRRKGNAAERACLKILKESFGGEPWERKSMGITGPDLLAPAHFPYAVEVKHHKSIRCKHFWKPPILLHSFWKQAEEQARVANKIPLLCLKVEGIWFAYWGERAVGYSIPMLLEDFCKASARRTYESV